MNVERSPTDPLRKRIFADSEFQEAGATLVPEGSWVDVPADTVILGLKELDETKDFPLKHSRMTLPSSVTCGGVAELKFDQMSLLHIAIRDKGGGIRPLEGGEGVEELCLI